MQNTPPTLRRLLSVITAAASFVAVSVQASTNVFDFNSDPASILTIYRAEEANSIGQAGLWLPTGGSPNDPVDPSTNGYLQITQGANPDPGAHGHRAVIVFDDFDAGLVVAGFTFQCDLRLGAGTDNPADGFSLNYARGDDPVIVNANGGGFAASPTGEANLPEEGTQTGLAICFDTWFSGGSDVIGMTIRVDNTIRTNIPLPTANGACADPTSMQTGPNTGGLGALCWQPLFVQLTTDGKLNVSYKGVPYLTNYAVDFAPGPGRLVFAGRVGGANQYQLVDNIRLVTIPSATPVVVPAGVNANGFRYTISDSGFATPDTNTITMTLDGAPVTPIAITQSGNIGGGSGLTVISHQNPALVMAAGTTHTGIVHFTGATFSGAVDLTNQFTVPNYTLLTTAHQAPGAVNTGLSGFAGRVHQLPGARTPSATSLIGIERQLANGFIDPATGQPYVSTTVGGVSAFTDDDAINWGQDAGVLPGFLDVGHFQEDSLPPADWTDDPIPGVDADVNTDTDNVAAELLAILNLPAGAYELGLNHDDSVKLTAGAEPRDFFNSLQLALSGSAVDSPGIRIVVTNAGNYPVRIAWGEASGPAFLEFYLIDFHRGQRILVNNRTNRVQITSYRDTAALTQPYVRVPFPLPNEVINANTNLVTVIFEDGTAATVVDGSITLNGKTPTISNVGGQTRATLTDPIAPGINTVTLVYSTTAGGPFTNTWSFNGISSKVDVTAPTDPITVYNPNGGSTPGAEGVANAINDITQKYLNFGDGQTPVNDPLGFVVVPSGPTVVTGMRLYPANDAPARDPAFVVLEGSYNGGSTWRTIFTGSVALSDGRNPGGTGANAIPINPYTQFVTEIAFANSIGYSSYRWYTTQLKGNVSLMQIAEVELLGTPGTLPLFLSINANPDSTLTITSSGSGTLRSTLNPALPISQWQNEGPITTTRTITPSPTEPARYYTLAP